MRLALPVERDGGTTIRKVHVDVSAGDVLREPYEILEAGLAWIRRVAESENARISREDNSRKAARLYPAEASRPNTRFKDLVDLVLLSVSGTLDAARVRESITATFRRRATHPVPQHSSAPEACGNIR